MGCDDKILPQTVSAPSTPLYQLGWLGDTYDITDLGPPVDNPTPIDVSVSYPDSPSYQDILANPNAYPDIFTPTNPNRGVVYGPPGPGQPGGVPISTGVTSSLTQALSRLFGGGSSSAALPPGPSPRVAQPGFLQSSVSLGSALPWLAVGTIAIVVLSNLGGGRRR